MRLPSGISSKCVVPVCVSLSGAMVETRVPVPVAVKEGYLHVGVLLSRGSHLLGARVASKFLASFSLYLSYPHEIQ